MHYTYTLMMKMRGTGKCSGATMGVCTTCSLCPQENIRRPHQAAVMVSCVVLKIPLLDLWWEEQECHGCRQHSAR